MPKDVTNRFMQALQQAESSRDPSALVELYAEDAVTQNLAVPPRHGRDGAREFWAEYLGVFQDIRSEFTAQTDTDTTGVMEWRASGHLRDGQQIEYRGVSIIEVQGGQVKQFRTYYDTAAFVTGRPR